LKSSNSKQDNATSTRKRECFERLLRLMMWSGMSGRAVSASIAHVMNPTEDIVWRLADGHQESFRIFLPKPPLAGAAYPKVAFGLSRTFLASWPATQY
jgi:hypothetical protein